MRLFTLGRISGFALILGLPFTVDARSRQTQIQNRIISDVQTVREVEALLFSLGFWTGPIDGVLDETSELALIAFQRMVMRPATGVPTTKDLAVLRKAKRPT